MPRQRVSAGGVRPQEGTAARFRSAAVARMVRMPVATLRIWERRYGVVSPDTSPSGHRLYTAEQVQRLALLKQLTDVGHAIGEIARLDLAALQQVAATHASAMASSQGRVATAPWRVVIVDARGGAGWQARWLRLPRPVQVVGTATDLDDLAASRRRRGEPAPDALVVALPHLLPEDLPRLQRAARACGAKRVGVCHGFAPSALTQRLRDLGMDLLREPADESQVQSWLLNLGGAAQPPRDDAPAAPVWLPSGLPVPGERRYDDVTLAAFAQLSSTIACECPRHVAELLLQLTRFEAYSAECEHRSPEDAALHHYLQQVAGTARTLFETALERVAQQEGLMTPAPRPPR